MTRTSKSFCLGILAAIGCGGGASSSSTVTDCNVSISGAPHSGSYKVCTLAGSSGNPYTLSFAELPGCSGCLASVTFSAIDSESCAPNALTQVEVLDTSWGASDEASTPCPPGGATDCVPQTPCTVNTTTATLGTGSAVDYTGHWSGSMTAHVATVGATPVSEADVTISGSF